MRLGFSLDNNEGFSLTELMVTVGILGIVMIIILSGAQILFKGAVSSERSQEATALMYQAMGIVGNPSLCSATVTGRKSTEGTEITISPEIKAGSVYAGKLRLESVRLGAIQELSGQARRAEVLIEGNKVGETLGSKTFLRKLTVFYIVGKDDMIQRCLGEAYDLGESCRALGGRWNLLSNSCNFCGGLGGLWKDGMCVLDPMKRNCAPIVEVIAGETLGGGVDYDKCEQWKQPWLNDVGMFLQNLPLMPNVNASDFYATRAAVDKFIETVNGFRDCTVKDIEESASSGAVKWYLGGRAAACDKTLPGTPRCSVSIRFDVNICNQ